MNLLSRLKNASPSQVILLAPVLFVAHVFEEAPGFVEWFNSLVARGINQGVFLRVNVAAFVIMLALAFILNSMKRKGFAIVALAWLSFLMFANALFHIVGTIVHGYSPGTVTAVVLYLPYFSWFFWRLKQSSAASALALVITTLIGGLPMAVHGYLIVFEGSRLF